MIKFPKVAALILFGMTSVAFAGSPQVCHEELRPTYCHDFRHTWQCGTHAVTVCRGGCAQPVEAANLSVADSTLKSLAASAEFAGATVFQAKVNQIALETDASVKFGLYADLIGMSNATQDDLANFRGARTADPKAVAALEISMSLNQAQSVEVVTALTAALNGNGALE